MSLVTIFFFTYLCLYFCSFFYFSYPPHECFEKYIMLNLWTSWEISHVMFVLSHFLWIFEMIFSKFSLIFYSYYRLHSTISSDLSTIELYVPIMNGSVKLPNCICAVSIFFWIFEMTFSKFLLGFYSYYSSHYTISSDLSTIE